MAVTTSTAPEAARSDGPGRRLRLRVVLAALLVVVVAGTASVVLVAREDRRLDGIAARSASATRATKALTMLPGALASARTALGTSAGRVDDDRVRTVLAAAVDEAVAAVHGVATASDDLDGPTARVVAAHDALGPATTAVTASVARWELAQATTAWSHAAAALDSALTSAQAALDSSAGRVSDEAVRKALSAAIDAARVVRDTDEPTDVAGLTSATAALGVAAGSLAAPQAAVARAVSSWESARAAAAVAAAAAKKAAKASSSKGASSKKPAAHATASPSSPSASEGLSWKSNANGEYTQCTDATGKTWWCNAVPVPGEASDGSHWEQTMTSDDSYSVCMDTEGNSWWCDQ